MPTLQKIAMGVIGVAMVATLVYPTHKTSDVANSLTRLTTGTLSTAEGTSTGAIG